MKDEVEGTARACDIRTRGRYPYSRELAGGVVEMERNSAEG